MKSTVAYLERVLGSIKFYHNQYVRHYTSRKKSYKIVFLLENRFML